MVNEKIGYDINGNEIDVEHYLCVAKFVKGDDRDRWFIKKTVGHSMGTPVDPHNVAFTTAMLKPTGMGQLYDFRSVNQAVFDYYLKYLKTKRNKFYELACNPYTI